MYGVLLVSSFGSHWGLEVLAADSTCVFKVVVQQSCRVPENSMDYFRATCNATSMSLLVAQAVDAGRCT
jgi:hypothetical protein